MKQTIQLFQRCRVLLRDDVEHLQGIIEGSIKNPGPLSAEQSAEMKRRTAFYRHRLDISAGLFFAMREALPPEEFSELLKRLKVSEAEAVNLLKIATESEDDGSIFDHSQQR